MKAAKHILFVAGLIGLIGAFVPLFTLGKGLTHVEVSARELSFGLSRTHEALTKEVPPALRKRMSRDALQAREDVRTVLKALRGAAAAFIPALIVLCCGALAMWRGELRRRLAGFALACGVLSLVAYLAVVYGVDYGKHEEPLLARVNLQIDLGAYLLIVAGIGGIVGGALGVWRPELRAPRASSSGGVL